MTDIQLYSRLHFKSSSKMKTTNFTLTILGVLFLLISCQQETSEQLTIIKGTFKNATTTEAYLWGNLSVSRSSELDENGSFTDTLDIDADGYFSIGIGMNSFPLFVQKGSSTSFTVDLNEEHPTLEITEGNQAIVDYLAKKSSTLTVTRDNSSELFGKEPEAFKQRWDSIFNSLKKDLSSLTADMSFKLLEEQALKFDEIYIYNEYPRRYKSIHQIDTFEVPAAFKDTYNNLDKDNEMYASSFQKYRWMITAKIKDDAYKRDGDERLTEEIIEILKEKTSPSIRDAVIESIMFLYIPKENSAQIKEELLNLATGNETKKVIQDRFKKVSNLLRGKSSPTFDFENFKGGKTTLEDFKGKYVYIDVWATWCSPCIAEIPSLKKLESEYEDANIAFASISVDFEKNYDKWRKMVTDKSLGGSQLIADNNFESAFVKDYAIREIPRFILIDPNGNIVSADAPKPSSEQLIAIFTQLGIK